MSLHTHCLICSSTALKTIEVYRATHLVKCGNCGFVFSQKIPTEQELIDYYDGYGRNDYLSPITIKRYNELLNEMEPFRKTNRLLDVGCGIGYFLKLAKTRGWEVYGTEYTDRAIEICEGKGITMKQGKLNSKDFEADSFDIITSFEVLEHINNPIEETNNFYQLLRKGGLIYLTTPNFNSLLRFRLKERYDVITYPEHLSYYTPKTLNNLFNRCGFKKKAIQTTGISLTKLKTSQGKTSQGFISETSDDENLRKQIEEKRYLQFAKKVVNGTLTIFGVGDSLKGWFIKK